MTGNRSYLTDYKEIDGGFVAFGNFKLTDKSHVLLKVPRKDNMYNVDLKNVVPQGGIENLIDLRVKVSRCVNETEFKNRVMNQFCEMKGKARVETIPDKDYILLLLWTQDLTFFSSLKDSPGAGFKPLGEEEKKDAEDPKNEDSEVSSIEEPRVNQEKDANVNNTNNINNVSQIDNAAGIEGNAVDENIVYGRADDPNMLELEDLSIFEDSNEDVFSAEADLNNLEYTFQEELSQFKLQEVWTLIELPNGKRAIGTKWVFRNKKDERGIVIKNKARLVAQGYTQEERIDYDEVFAPVSKIEAIRLFLAYASFKDCVVYQMNVKSAFLYGKIEEEVYVCQPLGFEDPDFLEKIYKVEKALYGLHQAPRAWYEIFSTYLLDNGFQRGKIVKTLFIKRDKSDILLAQKEDEIFICQDKYVNEILNKCGFLDVKTASTPMETQKPLLKDEDGVEVDVHMYRSMIGLLMYLTSSRPNIMFAFLGCRLISWKCKKQTVVANSTTEAEYIAASSCCGQVLWIQNQLLNFGYNFM
nr:hypothetical protein [Tanacetum cinerariifolium]